MLIEKSTPDQIDESKDDDRKGIDNDDVATGQRRKSEVLGSSWHKQAKNLPINDCIKLENDQNLLERDRNETIRKDNSKLRFEDSKQQPPVPQRLSVPNSVHSTVHKFSDPTDDRGNKEIIRSHQSFFNPLHQFTTSMEKPAREHHRTSSDNSNSSSRVISFDPKAQQQMTQQQFDQDKDGENVLIPSKAIVSKIDDSIIRSEQSFFNPLHQFEVMRVSEPHEEKADLLDRKVTGDNTINSSLLDHGKHLHYVGKQEINEETKQDKANIRLVSLPELVPEENNNAQFRSNQAVFNPLHQFDMMDSLELRDKQAASLKTVVISEKASKRKHIEVVSLSRTSLESWADDIYGNNIQTHQEVFNPLHQFTAFLEPLLQPRLQIWSMDNLRLRLLQAENSVAFLEENKADLEANLQLKDCKIESTARAFQTATAKLKSEKVAFDAQLHEFSESQKMTFKTQLDALNHQLERLYNEKQAADARIRKVNSLKTVVIAQLNESREELTLLKESLRARVTEMKIEKEKVQREAAETKTEMNKLRHEKEFSKSQIDDLQALLSKTKGLLKESEYRCFKAKCRWNLSEKQVQKLKSEIIDAEANGVVIETKNAELLDRLNIAISRTADVQSQLCDSRKLVDVLRLKNQALVTRLEELKSGEAVLKEDLKKSESENVELRSRLDVSVKKVDKLKSDKTRLTQQLADLRCVRAREKIVCDQLRYRMMYPSEGKLTLNSEVRESKSKKPGGTRPLKDDIELPFLEENSSQTWTRVRDKKVEKNGIEVELLETRNEEDASCRQEVARLPMDGFESAWSKVNIFLREWEGRYKETKRQLNKSEKQDLISQQDSEDFIPKIIVVDGKSDNASEYLLMTESLTSDQDK